MCEWLEPLLADRDLESDFDRDLDFDALLLAALLGLEVLRERDRELDFWDAFPLSCTGDPEWDLEREAFLVDSADGDLDLELGLPEGENFFTSLFNPSRKFTHQVANKC